MNETEEQRLVIKNRTFSDIAVDELGKQRAKCICCVQFGRCKDSECNTCSNYIKYVSLRNQMSEYDQLRLNNYISKYYSLYSLSPESFMTHKSFIMRTVSMIMMFIIVIALVIASTCIYMSLPYNTPPARYMDVSRDVDKQITETRQYVNDHIYDHNTDGLINCIDYATIFYDYWQTNCYPKSGYKCVIIRNKNDKTGMNHLFVALQGRLYIEVEPWYMGPMYIMEDVWGSMYDRSYNYYGETDKWITQRM